MRKKAAKGRDEAEFETMCMCDGQLYPIHYTSPRYAELSGGRLKT